MRKRNPRFSRMRQTVLAAARRTGREERLRELQAALASRETRRTLSDDEHFRLLCAFSLGMGSNCVDVGAHEGKLLNHMLQYAPAGDHWAFEPLPVMAQALQRSHPTVHVRQSAVSDYSGRARFAHIKDLPARSALHKPGKSEDTARADVFEVEVTTLDKVLPDDYVPSLIKIDVEGAELAVLRGAARLLESARPLVVFEHQPGPAVSDDVTSDLFHVFAELEMGIFDFRGHGPYDRRSFMATVRGKGAWNFLARTYGLGEHGPSQEA